jgi:hypothetical protein
MKTEKEKLIIALTQIENIVILLEDNEWKNYIYSHLNPIKYELERQITNESNSI